MDLCSSLILFLKFDIMFHSSEFTIDPHGDVCATWIDIALVSLTEEVARAVPRWSRIAPARRFSLACAAFKSTAHPSTRNSVSLTSRVSCGGRTTTRFTFVLAFLRQVMVYSVRQRPYLEICEGNVRRAHGRLRLWVSRASSQWGQRERAGGLDAAGQTTSARGHPAGRG